MSFLFWKGEEDAKTEKNEEKRIWVKIMNENRLELGAYSTIFLLAWEFDCTSLFEQSNRDLSIRLFELCICLKFLFLSFFLTLVMLEYSIECNSNIIARHFFIFFLLFPYMSFLARKNFSSQENFMQRLKNDAKSYAKCMRVCLDFTQTYEKE